MKDTKYKIVLGKKSKLSDFQARIIDVMYRNFFVGIVFVTSIFAFSDMYEYGLWHKILVYPCWFPIGMVLYIMLAICTGLFVYITLRYDYQIFTKGLEYIIVERKTDSKITPKTNDVLNNVEDVEIG